MEMPGCQTWKHCKKKQNYLFLWYHPYWAGEILSMKVLLCPAEDLAAVSGSRQSKLENPCALCQIKFMVPLTNLWEIQKKRRIGRGWECLHPEWQLLKMCVLSHLSSHHQGNISSPWALMVEKDLARFLPSFGTTGRNAKAQLQNPNCSSLKAGLSPAFLFCQWLRMFFICCWFLHMGVEKRFCPPHAKTPRPAWGRDTEAWHGTVTACGTNGVSLVELTSKFTMPAYFVRLILFSRWHQSSFDAFHEFVQLRSHSEQPEMPLLLCSLFFGKSFMILGWAAWLEHPAVQCPVLLQEGNMALCNQEESAVEGCRFNPRLSRIGLQYVFLSLKYPHLTPALRG